MPEDQETPTPMNELQNIEELMKNPDIASASGLILASWRLFWLARANLISVSKGRITDKNFPIVSQALQQSACSGFRIGKFKNDVKNTVLPFLKRLAAREARFGRPNDRPKPDPREAGGDEASADA
jgi:hypothetical protein